MKIVTGFRCPKLCRRKFPLFPLKSLKICDKIEKRLLIRITKAMDKNKQEKD